MKINISRKVEWTNESNNKSKRMNHTLSIIVMEHSERSDREKMRREVRARKTEIKPGINLIETPLH